jgi:NADH-quinone oxidoreductase subunit J
MITTVFFYIFATILVLAALRVITSHNPVHAVLFLVLAFVTSACLWIMLQAEFLAIALILIYVGAVMVLFLFVVMMLDIDVETMRKGFWKNLPLALVLGLVILFEMVSVIVTKPVLIGDDSVRVISNDTPNSNQLGWILYTKYSYPVELASLILLLGLVVATALTLRKREKKATYQNIPKQIAVNANKGRLEMVKMKAEPRELDTEEAITTSINGDKS